MADIVELTFPDNVELVAGATQNWTDLDEPAASTPVLRRLVADHLGGARTCLVWSARTTPPCSATSPAGWS